MTLPLSELKTPFPLTAHFLGEELSSGPLPALFYFSLSSKESLAAPPYCSLLYPIQDVGLRIFSFSLPFHEPPFSKFEAMGRWADEIKAGSYFLEDFLESATSAIAWLVEEEVVKGDKIALAGLSRGSFIATHVAARLKKVEILLGLAPLTSLSYLEEFKRHETDIRFNSRLETLNLSSLKEQLTHLRSLRYYIGNRDERVSTDLCYEFIRSLANHAHEKHARHANFELMLSHSIGHKGHGTSPAIFHEAGVWLKSKLMPD